MTDFTPENMHADRAEGAAQCTRDAQVHAWRSNCEMGVADWKQYQQEWNAALQAGTIPEGSEPPSATPPPDAPPECALSVTTGRIFSSLTLFSGT